MTARSQSYLQIDAAIVSTGAAGRSKLKRIESGTQGAEMVTHHPLEILERRTSRFAFNVQLGPVGSPTERRHHRLLFFIHRRRRPVASLELEPNFSAIGDRPDEAGTVAASGFGD